ncbi:MAG: GldG family protein [bacterium]|nr:GldG family protein [bacterium]
MKFSLRKKSLKKIDAYASLGLLILILVGVNLLMQNQIVRLDLTSSKAYTISATTKDTLAKLDDVINVKVFISTTLPPQLTGISQNIRDILSEYQNFGGQRFKLAYYDPQKDPAAASEAQSDGIQPLQFSDVSQEKLEVSNAYLGLAVLYEDRRETIPYITDTANLEYEITAAIKKVLREKPLTVAYLTGHEEASPYQDLRAIDSLLKSQYQTQTLDLTQLKKIPDDITTVVIINPQGEFSAEEKYYLDQFLMKGGGVLFAVSGVNVSDQLLGQANATNIVELLEKYGFKVSKDLVLDTAAEIAGFNTATGPLFVRYPYWVRVLPENISTDSTITSKLQTLLFPWPSYLDLSDELKKNPGVKTLAKSSKESWVSKNLLNLSPTQTSQPAGEKTEEKVLAVSLTGPLKSALTEKDKPKDYPDAYLKETNQARVVVIADGLVPIDMMAQRAGENLLLVQNAVDWLSQDESLTQIRVKQGTSRPIRPLTNSQTSQLKFLGQIYPLIVVSLLALALNTLRRRRLEQVKI